MRTFSQKKCTRSISIIDYSYQETQVIISGNSIATLIISSVKLQHCRHCISRDASCRVIIKNNLIVNVQFCITEMFCNIAMNF